MGDFDTELIEHVRSLRRYAIALTRSLDDADDIVQETLLRAINYGGNRSKIRDWQSYLFRILHNVRNDQLLRRARMPVSGSEENVDDLEISCPADQELLVECLQLQQALDELPEVQRQVVLLVGLFGCSYREVAEILEIPVGTVMSRLCRGRTVLRDAMDPAVGEAEGVALAEGKAQDAKRP